MRPTIADRPAARRLAPRLAAALVAASGCGKPAEIDFSSAAEPPGVELTRPGVRTIVRVVGQPSFIQAYEHTAIYAKLPSYVEKWNLDIGDKVKKNDVLATLFMPELVEEYRTKKADVVLAGEEVQRSLKLVEVAKANVETAAAQLAQAKAELDKFQAGVDRWDEEVKRLARESQGGVIAPQIVSESTYQLKMNVASRAAAKAAIQAAQSDLLSKRADAAKADVDVGVARARLAVAESDEKRVEALVGYLTLAAPFDGVVVGRNANTGDFVLPATGDPSARSLSPYQAPDRSAPIFVVDRTDVVRIFVDVPESDANYVRIGTKATVLARAYRDKELPASVTRTSWALNVKSRTLRAEIDLPNPDSQLLPGMYAYGKVIIERPGVRALPLDALVTSGDRTFCWQDRDGKAVRTELETGVSDGTWVEVTNRRAPGTGAEGDAPWAPIDGSERVILGDLSILTEGAPVQAAKPRGASESAGAAKGGDR